MSRRQRRRAHFEECRPFGQVARLAAFKLTDCGAFLERVAHALGPCGLLVAPCARGHNLQRVAMLSSCARQLERQRRRCVQLELVAFDNEPGASIGQPRQDIGGGHNRIRTRSPPSGSPTDATSPTWSSPSASASALPAPPCVAFGG